MPISVAQHHLINLLKMLGVTLLYTLLAELVIGYSATGFINIIYPSSGLGLAAVLIGGKRYALCVYFGALLINVIAKNPFWLTITLPIGNTLEALLGAWILTRNNKKFVTLFSLGDYLRLAGFAGAIGPGIAAMPGATILLVSGAIIPGTYFLNLSHWWMGDALGIIMITPLILVWRRGFSPLARSSRRTYHACPLYPHCRRNRTDYRDWRMGIVRGLQTRPEVDG